MNRCPHLGLEDDKQTCMSFATANHMCFNLSKPKGVPVDHQMQYCLHDEHLRCPVLLNGDKVFPVKTKNLGPLSQFSKSSARWVAIVATIAILVLSVWWVGTNTDIFIRPDPPVYASGELPPGITPTATRANRSIEPEITLVFDLTSQPDQSEVKETPEAKTSNP